MMVSKRGWPLLSLAHNYTLCVVCFSVTKVVSESTGPQSFSSRLAPQINHNSKNQSSCGLLTSIPVFSLLIRAPNATFSTHPDIKSYKLIEHN